MLTPTRGILLDSPAVFSSATPVSRASLNESSTSFAQQLADSLESYLGTSPQGARLEIDILPPQGGNSGTRQFIVTVRQPEPVSSSVVSTVLPIVPASVPVRAAATQEAAPATNLVDAYWASQPKEVQALRDIGDPEQRGLEAAKLSQQGFVIDYSIMVLGWNPYNTMKGRMQEGYTWTPSYGQSAIPVGPGLIFPGFASYDPAHPPPGSVPVSLDWARGLEDILPQAGSGNTATS
jgi:hypothetical protein